MATKTLNYTTEEINQRLNLAGTAVQPSVLNDYYTKTEVDGKVVVDLSVRYSTSYASLAAALAALNGDATATNIKKGGVSIKFINSTTNKYEQWVLKASSFSATESDWVSVTDVKAEDVSYNGESLADALSALENIEKQSTQSEEEAIIYETDGGVQVGKIDANGADFANLKRGGQQVARMSDLPTKDSTIGDTPSQTNVPTSKAVADYVEAHGGGTGDLPIEETVISSFEEYVVIRNSADTEDVFKVTDEGLRVKSIKDIQGYPIGGDNTLRGKTVMFIGDSVTASGRADNPDTSFASFFAQETGATVKNHSKGGIGIVAMVDGSGYDPDAQYDPDDYGISYLPPLTAEEVANCDYIVAFGFFNEVNPYESLEPKNYGTVDDAYVEGGTNTVFAKLNHMLDRIYECLSAANNDKCKVVLGTPYKCGHYPYSNGNGYSTYMNFANNCVKPFAEYHSLPCIDFMNEFGMNKYNWGVYTMSETVIASNYIPYVPDTEDNSPFPTFEDLPSTAPNNSYATVGTTSAWRVYKYVSGEWTLMLYNCSPVSQGVIASGGSNVGAYKWFADQLHPSLECRKQLAKYMILKLKNI